MPRGQYDRSKMKKKGMPKKLKATSPDLLQLTELELAKMEKLSTQLRACDGEVMITLSQKNAYIHQIDPQGAIQKFDQKINALKQERVEAEMEYKTVSAGVETRLGIKLSDFAYDDKTGVLRNIAEEKK
jgi:hypothetical protein